MAEKKISIDDLYTDSGSFDEQDVLNVLNGCIVFTKEHEILFTTDPDKLKARDVILLYSLAKKMLKHSGKIDDEGLSNTEIQDKTGLKKSTVGVTIMRLKEKKYLLPSGDGYEVPPFKVTEIIDLLNNDN